MSSIKAASSGRTRPVLKVYWWSPISSVRSVVGEIAHHGRAWTYLVNKGRSGLSNFGDAMNPWVVAELTGQRVVWSDIHGADLVCVGSVLNAYVAAGSHANILGAGIRSPSSFEVAAVDTDRVLSVRGLETARVLGIPEEMALGDPGLLIKTMYSRKVVHSNRPLILPHFGVLQSRSGQTQIEAARAAGFDVALPNESFHAIAQAIRRCSFVVTSSLHALVFADAFGVPCQLIDFGSLRTEPAFKYRDYLSVYGRTASVVSFKSLLDNGLPPVVREEHDQSGGQVARVVDAAIEGLFKAATEL